MQKVGAQCSGIVKDTKGAVLFVLKKHYSAELDEKDFLVLKDELGGMRYIPKETWKTCFKVIK